MQNITYTIQSLASCSPLSDSDSVHVLCLLVVELAAEAYTVLLYMSQRMKAAAKCL